MRAVADGRRARALAASEVMERDDEEQEVEVMEWCPSERYGRYKDVLGRGSFKTVYRGFDEYEGMEVAWNQMRVSGLPHEMGQRLLREVQILGQLQHPNVIRLYETWFSTVDGERMINFITESCSSSLRSYIRKHRDVHLSAIKSWARQILRGLNYLHTNDPPVIHRDLKSDNVFMNTNSGEVKLGDLGLAAFIDRQREEYAQSVIGTPEFMAPELYDEHYDVRVDIYSFGMCVLELITREYPYRECENPAQIYKKVVQGVKPDTLSRVASKVGPPNGDDAERFIRRCIGPIEERPSAHELLQDPFLRKYNEQQAGAGANPPLRADANGHDAPPSTLTNVNSVVSLNDLRSEASGAQIEELEPSQQQQQENGRYGHEAGNGDIVQQALPPHSVDDANPTPSSTAPTHQNAVSADLQGAPARGFNLKGKRVGDQSVKLKLKIMDTSGHSRKCEFNFYCDSDTPHTVAKELIEQLDLDAEKLDPISSEIAHEVSACMPGYKLEKGQLVPDESEATDENADDEAPDQPQSTGVEIRNGFRALAPEYTMNDPGSTMSAGVHGATVDADDDNQPPQQPPSQQQMREHQEHAQEFETAGAEGRHLPRSTSAAPTCGGPASSSAGSASSLDHEQHLAHMHNSIDGHEAVRPHRWLAADQQEAAGSCVATDMSRLQRTSSSGHEASEIPSAQQTSSNASALAAAAAAANELRQSASSASLHAESGTSGAGERERTHKIEQLEARFMSNLEHAPSLRTSAAQRARAVGKHGNDR